MARLSRSNPSSTTKAGVVTCAGSKRQAKRPFINSSTTCPGQAVAVQCLHEGIGIKLFHVPDARPLPGPGEHHHGADHRRHAGGVRDRLGADLPVRLLVVADVVDVELLFPAVLDSLEDTADAGAALGQRAEGGRFRQDGLEELQRDDFRAL